MTDPGLYQHDLAYIHATAFEGLARGAASGILELLAAASRPVRRVVDIGCGAGPLSAILADAGYEVTGIDPSAALLDIARSRTRGPAFLTGSAYEVPLPECDAILAVGEALTYHDDLSSADASVEHFFRRAWRAMPGGGLLLFDVIETGQPPLSGKTWAAGEDWAVLVETVEDSLTRSLERRIETFVRREGAYRRSREVHRVRLFDTGTLLKQLRETGFIVDTATTYGAYPLASRRLVFRAVRDYMAEFDISPDRSRVQAEPC